MVEGLFFFWFICFIDQIKLLLIRFSILQILLMKRKKKKLLNLLLYLKMLEMLRCLLQNPNKMILQFI
jgi:hypothetical protein